jgi:hypothetical protein
MVVTWCHGSHLLAHVVVTCWHGSHLLALMVVVAPTVTWSPAPVGVIVAIWPPWLSGHHGYLATMAIWPPWLSGHHGYLATITIWRSAFCRAPCWWRGAVPLPPARAMQAAGVKHAQQQGAAGRRLLAAAPCWPARTDQVPEAWLAGSRLVAGGCLVSRRGAAGALVAACWGAPGPATHATEVALLVLWLAVACCGLLWPAVACCGLLWPATK